MMNSNPMNVRTTVRILSRSAAVVAMLATALASSCSNNEDVKPDPLTVTQQPTDAGALPETQGPRKECPQGLPGPELVLVSTPGGTTYCIDATEVTQGQYFKFLDAKGAGVIGYPSGDMSGQTPDCAKNKSYANVIQELDSCYRKPEAWDSTGAHAEHAVGCVEWCDAFAYCAWAGKRLCGRVGGGRGAFGDAVNAELDQWYNACSQGGKTKYSYGDQADATRCVSSAYEDAQSAQTGTDVNAPRPPGEAADCRGTEPPFDQLVDLSGNVGEWVDIRGEDAPGGHSYGIRSYLPLAPGEEKTLQCSWGIEFYEHTLYPEIGFRCCLD